MEFVALLAIVPIPKIVVDPRVVVLVEEPLVTVETIADVVIADVVSVDTVMVEEYTRYFPVGVAASVIPPVKTVSLPELEPDPELELELDCAFAAMAKRQPYGRIREKSMIGMMMP